MPDINHFLPAKGCTFFILFGNKIFQEDFIPIKKDASDALEKIKWAQQNDDRAQGIAQSGSRKSRKLLTTENMYCYYAKAFDLYRYFNN